MGKNRKRVFREEKKKQQSSTFILKKSEKYCLPGSNPVLAGDLGQLPQPEQFQGPWSSGSACSQSKLDGLWQEIRHSKNFGKALWPWTGIIWELQDKTDCTWCTELFSSVI